MMGAVFAGLAAGLLTGAGIGGGTLLLVYLTNLGGMELRQAQGVNLIYFLITAPPALWGAGRECMCACVGERILEPE